ncbi:MAG: molybdopterin converting factor subunit 1 [Deltaproteobacteria bacterium]|nr:molybdopterin converting factor subunit 1 [Deltaproteobacteria bacterium]
MRISVRYFAVARERLKLEQEALDLAAGAPVRAVMDALCARHPGLAAMRAHLRVAVNQDFVADDHVVADGDEVALIPPVAGGAGALVRVQDAALSLDEVVRAVGGPGLGGVVTFTGVVRDSSQGKRVERLEYEAYVEMAEKVIRALVDEVEAETGARIAVLHRIGKLAIGDLAVVIAAAAAHRAEAFTACRAVIDRLKERAPIWKKEFGDDGAVWVGMGP